MTATPNHRGWTLPAKETLVTFASLITIVRTIIAVVLTILAAYYSNEVLLLYGVAAYWVGDILDGIVARARHEETRSGAVLDIMADRLCVAMIYLVYAFMHQSLITPVGMYLVEFMFVDGFLSLAFLFWPLLSPNYFFLVDRCIFTLNWSKLGKVVNSSVFLLVTVLFQQPLVSAGVVIVVTAIKIYSIVRLYRVVGIPS